jgi:hypothetical protein
LTSPVELVVVDTHHNFGDLDLHGPLLVAAVDVVQLFAVVAVESIVVEQVVVVSARPVVAVEFAVAASIVDIVLNKTKCNLHGSTHNVI